MPEYKLIQKKKKKTSILDGKRRLSYPEREGNLLDYGSHHIVAVVPFGVFGLMAQNCPNQKEKKVTRGADTIMARLPAPRFLRLGKIIVSWAMSLFPASLPVSCVNDATVAFPRESGAMCYMPY
jgi:hypothetical protein